MTRMRTPDSKQFSNTTSLKYRALVACLYLSGLAAVFAIGLTPISAAAQEEDAICHSVKCLANELIEGIPDGEKIALIPLWTPVTNLPKREATDLYDRIYRAMSGASDDVLKRNREFDELWNELEFELKGADYQTYVDNLRAAVIVLCKDRGLEQGKLKLNCTATGYGDSSALGGEMVVSEAVIPVDRALFQYEYALTQLGNTLVAEVRKPKRLLKIFVAESGTGQRSKLTENLSVKVGDVMRSRFRQLLEEREEEREFSEIIGHESAASLEEPRGYELYGSTNWMNEQTMDLRVELRDGGHLIAHATARIERSWIPRSLIDQHSLRYYAEARAIPSRNLSVVSAPMAASSVARARIVAKALDIPAPKASDISSEAEGIAALQFLEQGIPTDEMFQSSRGADGETNVTLSARVVKVGSDVRPALEAVLLENDLTTSDPIRIALSATERVSAAVFGWGADNNVVRIYPNDRRTELIVPADGHIVLPAKADRMVIRSAPLQDHVENHEAILVIASSKQLDYGSLGTQTVEPSSKFLNALATLDLSHATVAVLPYRIKR